jgi:hypothetical protein
MPAYIKKDKNHDVLGNRLNPEKFFVSEELYPTITFGTRSFYIMPNGDIQCCMCLNIMQLLAEPKEDAKNNIRRLYIPNECACTREK